MKFNFHTTDKAGNAAVLHVEAEVLFSFAIERQPGSGWPKDEVKVLTVTHNGRPTEMRRFHLIGRGGRLLSEVAISVASFEAEAEWARQTGILN